MPIYPPVRTFHARHGRLSQTRRAAIAVLVPTLDVARHRAPVDLHSLFPGRTVVVDFGAGMGAHTRELALAGAGVLAIDVHSPGIGRIAEWATQGGHQNVAVHLGDGMTLLTEVLAEGSTDEVHVLFPDPWPKARHHKRRLISPTFLAAAHRVLVPGGRLAIVSDDPTYTEHISGTLSGTDLFLGDDAGFHYLPTGYHERAERLGHRITVFAMRRA